MKDNTMLGIAIGSAAAVLGFLLVSKKAEAPSFGGYTFNATYGANDVLGNLTGNTPTSDLGSSSCYSGMINNPRDLAQASGGNVDSLGNPAITTTDKQVQATLLPSDWQAAINAAKATYPDSIDAINAAENHLKEAIAWKESWDAAGGVPANFDYAGSPAHSLDITKSTNYLVAQSLLNNVQTYESYHNLGGSQSYSDWANNQQGFGYYGAGKTFAVDKATGAGYLWDEAGSTAQEIPIADVAMLQYLTSANWLITLSPNQIRTMAGGAYADVYNKYIAPLATAAGVGDDEKGEVARLRQELANHEAIAASDWEKAHCPNPKEVYPHLAEAFSGVFDDPDEGWVVHFMSSYNGQLKSIASYQGYIANSTVASQYSVVSNAEKAAAAQAKATASALAKAQAASQAAAAAQSEATAQAAADAWTTGLEDVRHYREMGYFVPPSQPEETPSETYQAAAQEHEAAAAETSSTAVAYQEAAEASIADVEALQDQSNQTADDFAEALGNWATMSGKVSPDSKAFVYPRLGIYDVPGETNPVRKINWVEYEQGRQLGTKNKHLKVLPIDTPSFKIGYEHGVEGKQLRLAR